MKNIINYYYNLIPENIHHKNNIYYFDYNNTRYFLTKYLGDIDILKEIYNTHINLLNSGIYIHQIILNKENNIITLINSTPFILLKTIYYDGPITKDNILSFSNIGITNNSLDSKPWSSLWENKNDYLEYQMSELGQKHPLLKESFSYYIGLGETAISLCNLIENKKIPKIIAHKRIGANDTIYDLYNPLNLIIDSRVRDITEYFKSAFFNKENITLEIKQYLTTANLTNEEYLLFLARMLYPTYYFDIYENIIGGKANDKDIKNITNKVNEYEKIIKEIYNICKSKITIHIEWLEL